MRLIASCCLLMLLVLFSSVSPTCAGITPHEVVVVYNGHPAVAAKSLATASYYCAQRGIPTSNIKEVVTDPGEITRPDYFVPDVEEPLRDFLTTQMGSDPAHPETDPVKAIVLCYGIPSNILKGDRQSSVDSALSCLFNDCPWGSEPIGRIGQSHSHQYNPYYENQVDPAQRTKPADFGLFRASTYNDWVESPPAITIVRMLDADHALAAGDKGCIYRRERVNGAWGDWTAVADKDRGFVARRGQSKSGKVNSKSLSASC